MAEQFDPYYTWFGIPPEEQPADHYRLLGVRPLEANDEVIVNAADQRMAYLRTFQVGKRTKESQRLLNEVAVAQSVLLDPKKKKEYDEQLRRKAASKNAAAPTATAALPTAKPLRDSQPLPQQPLPLQPVVLQPVVVQQHASPVVPPHASHAAQPHANQAVQPHAKPDAVRPQAKPLSAQPAAAASSIQASAFPTLSKPVKRGGLSMTTAVLVGGGSAFAGLCVLLAALAWAAARPAPRSLTNNPPVPPPAPKSPPIKDASPDSSPRLPPPAKEETPPGKAETPPVEKQAAPSVQPADSVAKSEPPEASSPAETLSPKTGAPPAAEGEPLRPGVIVHARRFGNPVQYRLVLSPDGTRYFGVDAKARVCVAHHTSNQPSHGFNGMTGVIFSPDSKQTAMWSTTNEIQVRSAGDSPQQVARIPVPAPVRCATFTSDGQWIVVGIDGPPKLVAVRASGESTTAPDLRATLPNVSWIGEQGGHICCWSPARQAEVLSLIDPGLRMSVTEDMPNRPSGITTKLGWLALIPINENIALHYWRPETGQKWAEFQVAGLSNPADFLATSSEGGLVAVRQTNALALVAVPGNKVLTRIDWPAGRFHWAAFTKDESQLAVNAPDDYLWLLDVKQLLAQPSWRVPSRDERAALGL